MKKGEVLRLNDKSARENIILIAAMSGGEILSKVAVELSSTRGYYHNVVAGMKKRDEAVINYSKPRTLLLKQEGVFYAEKYMPYIYELYITGALGKKSDKSERRASISQSLYNSLVCGIPIYPTEKRTFTEDGQIANGNGYACYSSLEVKAAGKKEMYASRLHAVIVGNKRLLCLYNTLDKATIKYRRKIERNMQIRLEKMAEQPCHTEVVFYTDHVMPFMKKVIENTDIQKRMPERKTLDVITTDLKAYVIPNGKEGVLYSKLLLHTEIMERLVIRAREQEKRIVVSAIPLYLPTCNRLRQERSDITVLCLEEQVEMIKQFNQGDNVHLMILDRDKLEHTVEMYLEKKGEEK